MLMMMMMRMLWGIHAKPKMMFIHVYRRFCVPERIDANRKLHDSAYERHTDWAQVKILINSALRAASMSIKAFIQIKILFYRVIHVILTKNGTSVPLRLFCSHNETSVCSPIACKLTNSFATTRRLALPLHRSRSLSLAVMDAMPHSNHSSHPDSPHTQSRFRSELQCRQCAIYRHVSGSNQTDK